MKSTFPLLVAIAACNAGPDATTTLFEGAVISGSQNAAIAIAVDGPPSSLQPAPWGADLVMVTATIDALTLTGAFDPTQVSLSLSNDSGYSLTATLQDNTFSGTYDSPNGNGDFVAVRAAAGDSVIVFCAASTASTNANLNLIVSDDNTVIGYLCLQGDSDCLQLSGAVADGAISVSDGTDDWASATVAGDTVNGSWRFAGDDGGSFSGTRCN